MLYLAVRPTAIFAASDELAAGVIEAARQRDLKVPSDVSAIGYDDSLIASMVSPPLTTVRQPLREMGGMALTTAMRLIADTRLLAS